MRPIFASLTIFCLISLCGCAQTSKIANSLPPSPVTATGQDVLALAASATQAYVDYKSGNVDFAWGLKHGLDAYSQIAKTSTDVKAVVKAWTANTPGSDQLATKLATVFNLSTASPADTLGTIARAVEAAASNTGP